MIRYLAYGSNLHPARLGARCPSARSLGRVRLDGWGLRFHKRSHDGSGKCDLVEAPDETAWGALYTLSEADKLILDGIEGVGCGYAHRFLTLADGEALTYVVEPAFIDPAAQPYGWYHRFVVDGARHHGFPADYVQQLVAVPTLVDPDSARRALNAEILSDVSRD